MDDAGLEALRDAIKHLHGCDSRWIESIGVHESHEGRTVWEGEVQRFALVGHLKAKECFAWSHATEGTRRQFHAVLRLPPVDTASQAVQTAVMVAVRKGQN